MTESVDAPSRQPAIVLVSDEYADQLEAAFWRYSSEYELHLARSCAEALTITEEVRASGGTVALFATDSRLPDDNVLAALSRWRSVIPTARRMIVTPVDRFLEDADALRPGMAKGKYDAYLLMPRGIRDEEFHNAVTDLLSDWGSTVARPEVVAAKIVTDEVTPLVADIRDFLDRMGMPNSTYHPDSEVGRHILEMAEPTPPIP